MKSYLKQGIAILLMSCLSLANTHAQNECSPRPDSDYLVSYWYAGLETLKQPLHYNTTDWLITGGAVASVALVYNYDREGFDFFDRQMDVNQAKHFSRYSDAFGSGLISLPLLGGMYLVGHAKEDCQIQQAALAGLQAFLLSAGAAYILKSLSGRPRPFSTTNPHEWHGPFNGKAAFPSGHTTRAFALAAVISGYYPEKLWVGLSAYSLAALTASGRLLSGEHWPSDVLAGALLGYFIGRGVLHYHKKQRVSKTTWNIEPRIGFNSMGLVVNL